MQPLTSDLVTCADLAQPPLVVWDLTGPIALLMQMEFVLGVLSFLKMPCLQQQVTHIIQIIASGFVSISFTGKIPAQSAPHAQVYSAILVK